MEANKEGTSDSISTNESKVALVTGANQGVGFQIARALAAKGYVVYIGSRNVQNGKEAAGKIGGKSRVVQLDVTDKNSIAAAVEKVREAFGRLDLLVNNAGISHAGKPGSTMEEIMTTQKVSVVSIDEMRTVWETNVFGVVAVTQAFLPLIRQAPTPRIVNVSSGLGSLTLNMNPSNPWRSAFSVVYGASKSAMNAITVALAMELEGTGIKVNAVSPGYTATALNNFQGTDTVEEGSKEPVRVALEEDGPSGMFTGPNQEVFPW